MQALLIAVIVLVNVHLCFAGLSGKLRRGLCKPDNPKYDCPYLASVPQYCEDQVTWTSHYCHTSCWCAAPASSLEYQATEAIQCRQRTELGHCCFFPFMYKGRLYDSCIQTDHGKPWCSLTASFDVWHKWDEC